MSALSRAPVAHVLLGTIVPGWLLWLLGSLIGLGLLIGLSRSRRWVRRAGWTVCLVSAAAYQAMVLVFPAVFPPPPAAPAYSISLAEPSSGTSVGSPVAIEVCGRTSTGNPSPVPDGSHVLAVLVDGVEVMAMRTASFALPMTVGRHRLRVELLSYDHRAFQPEVATQADFSVRGPAPLPTATPCRSAAGAPPWPPQGTTAPCPALAAGSMAPC